MAPANKTNNAGKHTGNANKRFGHKLKPTKQTVFRTVVIGTLYSLKLISATKYHVREFIIDPIMMPQYVQHTFGTGGTIKFIDEFNALEYADKEGNQVFTVTVEDANLKPGLQLDADQVTFSITVTPSNVFDKLKVHNNEFKAFINKVLKDNEEMWGGWGDEVTQVFSIIMRGDPSRNPGNERFVRRAAEGCVRQCTSQNMENLEAGLREMFEYKNQGQVCEVIHNEVDVTDKVAKFVKTCDTCDSLITKIKAEYPGDLVIWYDIIGTSVPLNERGKGKVQVDQDDEKSDIGNEDGIVAKVTEDTRRRLQNRLLGNEQA